MKRSIMVQILVVTWVSVLLTGCGQVSNDQSRIEPVKTDMAGTIGADCVVNFYRTDKSPYITEQQHRFAPEAGYLNIVSREPYGVFNYTLKKDQFSSTKRAKKGLSDLDVDFCDKRLATAIFYSFSAGTNLLDKSLFATSEIVKIEGQWYQPYQPEWPLDELRVTLLQGIGSDRVELVQITDSETGGTWMARSYNMRYSKQLERLAPRKIDVFDISAGVASKKLIVQIDYKSIQFAQENKISEENNG